MSKPDVLYWELVMKLLNMSRHSRQDDTFLDNNSGDFITCLQAFNCCAVHRMLSYVFRTSEHETLIGVVEKDYCGRARPTTRPPGYDDSD